MEIFSLNFMRKALIAIFLISGIAPLIGTFLVLRKQSLMADTLSHISLAGIALGFFLNFNVTFTNLLVVVLASIVLEYLRNIYKGYSEISTAILMSGGLSLALILISCSHYDSINNIQSYLFGSLVTINYKQILILIILFIIIISSFFIFKRAMYLIIFDENIAYVEGLPVKILSICFNIVTGISISVMIPIAGALLISSIIVLPAAIALKIGKTFNLVLILGILISFFGMIVGFFSSYYLNTPPGPSITLIFIFVFLIINISKKVNLYRSQKNK